MINVEEIKKTFDEMTNEELAKYCVECRDLIELGEEILDGSTRLLVKESD